MFLDLALTAITVEGKENEMRLLLLASTVLLAAAFFTGGDVTNHLGFLPQEHQTALSDAQSIFNGELADELMFEIDYALSSLD